MRQDRAGRGPAGLFPLPSPRALCLFLLIRDHSTAVCLWGMTSQTCEAGTWLDLGRMWGRLELCHLSRLQEKVTLSQPCGEPSGRAGSGIWRHMPLCEQPAGAPHPCRAISVSDTCYHFLGGLCLTWRRLGTLTDSSQGLGSWVSERPWAANSVVDRPWITRAQKARKMYCPFPIEFVLHEGQATVGRLLASLQGNLFILVTRKVQAPYLQAMEG